MGSVRRLQLRETIKLNGEKMFSPIHICFGSPDDHLDELEKVARTNDELGWWTINQSALPGDQVVFYMVRPMSAFVATAVVMTEPWRNDDATSEWYGHYVADMKHVKMLPRFIPLSEARERFPAWGFLRQPRRSILVPSAFAEDFLTFCLRIDQMDAPPQQPEHIGRMEDLEQVRSQQEVGRAFAPADLEDARRRILAAIVLRQGQQAFREQLLVAYRQSCAVTGCDVVETLEAAHIVAYRGPDTNHVTNGLLLRADIHTLFDLGLLAVHPTDYRLLVAGRLRGTAYEALDGQIIRLPTNDAEHPSREALEWHLAAFQAKESGSGSA